MLAVTSTRKRLETSTKVSDAEDEKNGPDKFFTRSVDDVANNCDEGHCGCYFSNQNKCCRCGKIHIERKTVMQVKDEPFVEQLARRLPDEKRNKGSGWFPAAIS